MRSALFIASMMLTVGALAQPAAFDVHAEATTLSGQEVRVDIYLPSVEPVDGVAIVAHGFGRSRVRHRELGEALAQAGVIAVIPDLPHLMGPWANGDAIVELAAKLETGEFGLAPVQRQRLVLIGTSAGGLVTVLAAAKLSGLAGWVGLDPVDRTGAGASAGAKLKSSAVVLLGDPTVCNLFGSGRTIARAIPGLLRSTKLAGASHCDFEGPTNTFCRALCGAGSAAMQAHVREETVTAAFELLHARGNEAGPKRQDPAE